MNIEKIVNMLYINISINILLLLSYVKLFEFYVYLLYGEIMRTNLDYNAINCICLASGKRSQNLENEQRQIIRDTYTLYYITSGKGMVTIDGIGYLVSAGQSVLTFPFSNVCLEADNDLSWEYSWVEFRGLEAAWLVSQTSLSKKHPVVEKIPVRSFESLFNIEDSGSDSTFAQCRAGGKLIVLLSYYVEYFPCKDSENVNYAILARKYIEKNYRNYECSVQSVANHIQIDRTYLYRLFKSETGMSVIDYINHCRISKAEVLLIDDSISIKDVAYSVGFTDQMYFSKVFKKLKGQTPTEFRRKNNGKYI